MRRNYRYLFLSFFCAYLVFLLRIIVFKGTSVFVFAAPGTPTLPALHKSIDRANLVPGRTLWYYLSLKENAETGVQNIGGNFLAFVPFGLLFPLAFPQYATFRRLLVTAFCLSLLFELIQLFTALGNFDVDDLLLNTLGALCGYGILKKKKMPNH